MMEQRIGLTTHRLSELTKPQAEPQWAQPKQASDILNGSFAYYKGTITYDKASVPNKESDQLGYMSLH